MQDAYRFHSVGFLSGFTGLHWLLDSRVLSGYRGFDRITSNSTEKPCLSKSIPGCSARNPNP